MCGLKTSSEIKVKMFLITIQKIVFIVRIISNKMELCEKLNNWMVSVEIKAWKKIENIYN